MITIKRNKGKDDNEIVMQGTYNEIIEDFCLISYCFLRMMKNKGFKEEAVMKDIINAMEAGYKRFKEDPNIGRRK